MVVLLGWSELHSLALRSMSKHHRDRGVPTAGIGFGHEGNAALSELEFVAVAFGFANIAFLIRKSVLNFPCGIVMVSLYAAIFFETRLYSEALLQVFFFC